MNNETDLRVIVKAKQLIVHTLRITSNTKHFPKKFRHSLVDKIQIKSIDIRCKKFSIYVDIHECCQGHSIEDDAKNKAELCERSM